MALRASRGTLDMVAAPGNGAGANVAAAAQAALAQAEKRMMWTKRIKFDDL